MGLISASVFILTKNSSKTLPRALESVKEFDDIVICDGGSTDETRTIAKDYGARIYDQDKECLGDGGVILDYAGVRNSCFVHTKHDWVAYLDSDEEMSRELREEIKKIAQEPNPKFLFWQMPCRIVFDGKEVLHSSNYPGYQVRFFNKESGARFVKPLHEKLDFDRNRFAVGTLKGPWRYFGSRQRNEGTDDIPYYLSIEEKRLGNLPFRIRMRLSIKSVFTALKILIKASRNYLLYGFAESAPLFVEYSRLKYQLLLAATCLLRRAPGSSRRR